MRLILAAATVLITQFLCAQDGSREAIEQGVLPPRDWEGIAVRNPGELRADVTLFLRRDEVPVDQVAMTLDPHQERVVRMDRLFLASVDRGVISFRSTQPVFVSGYIGTSMTPAATILIPRRRSVRSASPPVLVHRTVVLTPSKDNTLYQTSDGSLSNGAGPHLFAGTTQTRQIRRALIAFNVTSQIPPGSQVTRVTLKMSVSQSISGTQPVTLHALTTDWGEGASNAGFSRDGDGTSSQAGDATWIHTFFPDRRWTTAGGDFEATADSSASGSSEFTWESPAMITRLQKWLDQPATNFGWIAMANESVSPTAKRFDSREISPEITRPSLTIEFDTRQ